MKRKIDNLLKYWKNNLIDKALYIYGARQIGKTYSIEKFIQNEFEDFLEINFANEGYLLSYFDSFNDKEEFYNRILLQKNLKEGSVIFFDEIQELYLFRQINIDTDKNYYKARVDLFTLIKELVKDNKYRYIFSGSLLGVTINNINLDPLGSLYKVKMYPLDFEEFLWAKDINNDLIKYLKDCFLNFKEVDEVINNKFLDLFKEYILVGGMPKALTTYLKTKSIYDVSIENEIIINYYKVDIIKYAPLSDRLLISEIFNSISTEINSKNKRFTKNHLNYKNIKNLSLEDKFLWLSNAGIALPTYNVSSLEYPLKLNEERKVLKLFYNDIGILSYILLGNEGRIKYLNDELNINYGAPYENVVAEELYAHGFNELNYYNSKKLGEIDFIIEKGAEIIPLEIKSGKLKENNLYNHNALNNSLIKYKNIKKAYVLGNNNISKENEKIYYLPIYMIMFIKANNYVEF